MSLLLIEVQCKPIDNRDTEEKETVAKPKKPLEVGDTYDRDPEMYIASGSGSGDDSSDLPDDSVKVYCPPTFIEMWMDIFDSYPEKCMDNDEISGDNNDDNADS